MRVKSRMPGGTTASSPLNVVTSGASTAIGVGCQIRASFSHAVKAGSARFRDRVALLLRRGDAGLQLAVLRFSFSAGHSSIDGLGVAFV